MVETPVEPTVTTKAPVVREPPVVQQVLQPPRKFAKPLIRKVRPPRIVRQDVEPVRVIRRVERFTPPRKQRIRVVRRRFAPVESGFQEPVYSAPAYSPPAAYDWRLNRDGGRGGGGGGGGGGWGG